MNRTARIMLHGSWALAIVAAVVVLAQSREPAPTLPVIGSVPDFAFRDCAGEPVGLADLHGRVWVIDFIFTRCVLISSLRE